MEIHRLVLLSFMLFASKVRSESFYPMSSGENLRNIILTGSHVIVGSTDALYRLNPSLSECQETRMMMSSPNRMLVADPDGTYSDSVLECGTSRCSLLRISDLNDVRWEVSSGVVGSATDEVVGIFATGPNGTSSLHIGERVIPQPARRSFMSKGDLVNVDSPDGHQFDPYAYQGEGIDTRQREFLSSFRFQTFVYFVFRIDNMFTSGSVVRLVRFCQEDRGGFELGNNERPFFASRYEADLDCQSSDGSGISMATAGYSATFINSPEPFGTESVLVSFGNFIGMGASATQYTACAYNLTLINELMQTKYDTCIAGGVTGDNMVGFIRDGQQMCQAFSPQQLANGQISECNFAGSLLAGLEVKNPIAPISQSAFLSHELRGYFTTLVHTPLDGYSFLFAGSSDGKLFQFQITSSSSAQFIRTITLDIPADAGSSETNVTRLLASQDGEFIYALTPKKVFRIPVEQCSTFTDCQSCTADTNPLCGWCTVESKCSRRSKCRNSSEPMRWVQETNQCILSVADPAIFVLDNPQNIIVTVTPGLPPPLDGESYECYFTAADGTSFSTDAVEVVTDTQYMCDLTEVVPDIQGASLVTDFSFRSTAVGIPFATEEGGVTVYDCPEASSCSECLQTQNSCGWCIYNKRCSGTPEPCLNSIETFFLSPGVGQTFVDICPLLEPGPFSGEYVQTVTIERNITLTTSNLPEPITGFSYGCMIGDVALSAEYINATSFTCIVDGNQLSLLSGDNDGRDRVPVRIVWRSDDGTVVHSIDTRDGASITALLYNCNGVASSCSACLASSMGTGLECAWLNSGRSCVLDTTAGITTNPLQCPDPVITGISPTMGPLEGGTTITITGTDLGTVFSDINGNVAISGQLCDTTGQEAGYIPGLVIVCVTPNLGDINDFTIVVTLLRTLGLVNAPSPVPFMALTPNVTGVEPELGPVAGGTILRVMGTNLGIGNVEDTRVTVGGQECTVQNPSIDISEAEIRCLSAAFSGDSSQCMSTFTGDTSQCNDDTPSRGLCPRFDSSVHVQVSIDAFTSQPSITYTYACDPTFSRVCPTDTIPVGGIRLTFSGCNLNVVQQPSRKRQTGVEPCNITDDTTIVCFAPSLSSATAGSIVNYTIIVDGAEGPDITIESLQLTVVPNPEFSGSAVDQEYSEDSGNTIQIPGTNLFSVDLSEYQVTVGGQECVVRDITAEQELLCTPPQRAPNGQDNAPVMVSIGINLEYSVGTLTYPKGSIVATVVPAVIIPLIVLLAVIILLIVIFVYFHRHHSNVTLRDKDLGELQLQPAVIQNQPLHINEFMKQLPQKLIVASDQLQLLDSIGQGEFGTVYKAHLIHWHGHEEPQLVAAKTLKGLFSPNDVQRMMDEILKMQDFDHPHVMSLLGVCLDTRLRLSTIMPYMANGSLLDHLKKDRMHLVISESETPDMICSVQKLLLRLCYQIAQGMEYLAEQKFVHRDLAARNCMLNYMGDIKVADFGLSEDMYATGYFRQANVDASVKLPYKWMPPESLEDGLFSEKSDVWAFGVTCWEMFTGGKVPYPAVDPMSLIKLLENGQRLEKPSNAACSRKIYSGLMQRCWLDEPSMRPAFSDLVLSISQILESVAGYKELNMSLVQPAAAEIPVEKNPVYGMLH